MKSLHIGLRWSGSAGGAERVFADLAAALPEAGVKFLGLVAGDSQLSARTCELVYSFAPEHASTIARMLGVRKVLPELLQAKNPDVVASHFAMYTFPILDKLRTRPLVVHFHGPWFAESKAEGASGAVALAKRMIERKVYARADRLIVLSNAFFSLLSKQFRVPEDRIRVVPGAVDLEYFSPGDQSRAREALSWPTGRPILLTVRRLVNRMGLQGLITAIHQVRSQIPDVLLFVGGTGPLRPALEAQVRELNLEEHVRFLGFIPTEKLPLAYRAATLTVIPSAALEGFGLVAAESLASGTPALVTPVGGLPEVVAGLSRDLVLESCSVHDLVQSLTAFVAGNVRLPTADQCREYAATHFARDLMAKRVADVYRELA